LSQCLFVSRYFVAALFCRGALLSWRSFVAALILRLSFVARSFVARSNVVDSLRSSKEEDKKEKDKEEVKSFATPSQLVPSKKGDDGKKKVPQSPKMQSSATHLQPRLDQKEYRKQKGGKGSGSFTTPRQAESSHKRNEKEKFPGGSEVRMVRTAPWSRSGTGQVAVSFGQEPGRRWEDRRPPPQLKYIPARGPPSHTSQQRFGAKPRPPKLMIPELPRTESGHQRQLQDPSVERRIRGQLPHSSHCSTPSPWSPTITSMLL
jgi:hypothetical protein